ncbi:MAG: tRNA-intron lyase [Nanobdellota archaeon]
MSIKAIIYENYVLTEACDKAKEIYDKSKYGVLLDNGQLQLSFYEGIYLHEKKKITISDRKGSLELDKLLKKAKRFEKLFLTKYMVYKDLRSKGYIVKTALKFGADFRVYDKGIKPGEDHAKWIVYAVPENKVFSWHDFSAKNRVAHSTKKRLLMAVADSENSVTYYEVRWIRP